MSDRLEDLIDEWGRHFEPATHAIGRYGMPKTGNVTDWQLTLTKDGWKFHKAELMQALQSYIDSKIIEELERILDGQGRKTGVWHYELNDANEMEASYMGEYVKISELQTRLAELKEALNHRKDD